MDKSTVKFALSVLDTEFECMIHTDRENIKSFEAQMRYYEGLLRMAEIIVSQTFVAEIGILIPSISGRDGKHCILYGNWNKLFADDET